MSYGVHGNENRVTHWYPVTTASAIMQGDMLKISRQTVDGVENVLCVTPCTSTADKPFAVAAGSCDKPSEHGKKQVICYVSEDCEFEYPPNSGTVDGSLVGKLCDVGGAQSLDIDGSTVGAARIRSVDKIRNTCIVTLKFNDAYVGVE